MVVDNGQVGFLSEVRKNGAIFTPLPIKPEQEKRAMLYITLSETYQQLYHYEAETHEENADMREHLNEYYDEFVDRYGNLNEKQNAKFSLIYSTTRYPSPLTKLLLSIHLWRRYQRRLINMER